MNLWRCVLVSLLLMGWCGVVHGKLTTLVEERLVEQEETGLVELHQLWEAADGWRVRRYFLIDGRTVGQAKLLEWGDYESGMVTLYMAEWLNWGVVQEFLLNHGYEDYLPPELNRGQTATVYLSDGLDVYLEAVKLFSSGQVGIDEVDGVQRRSGSPYMLSRFWMYPSVQGGWRETSTGLINDNTHPWVFSMTYGFLFEEPISPENAEYAVWSWSPTLGWIYIFPEEPSFIYKAETLRWAWRNPEDGLIWDL